MEALLSRRPRDAKKESVTRSGRLRELREWFSYSSTRGLRVRWTLRELAQLQINISINLDIHSTFVSFLLNSVIRSKCDWVRKAQEVYLIYKEKTLSPVGKKDVTKLDDNYMIKLSLHLHQSPSIFLFVTIFQFHCHFFSWPLKKVWGPNRNIGQICCDIFLVLLFCLLIHHSVVRIILPIKL